jgi:LytR cell envelope-related transcriptional attenuator
MLLAAGSPPRISGFDFMVLFLAFSLQDKVEQYGAYVGLAAFLGLAVLSLLYFAQARELKRLRDWAGRAPERQQELEARVVAQAESALRGPQAAPQRSGSVGPAQPVAKPAAVPAPAAGNGRQTGVPVPIGPRPATAVAAAAAAAKAAEAGGGVATQEAPAVPATTPEPATDGAPATNTTPEKPEQPAAAPPPEEPKAEPAVEPEPAEPEPEPVAAGGGNGVPDEPVIPRATPRPQPRPAPAAAPLRSSVTRTASPAPPRRKDGGSSNAGRITAFTLLGIVVVAAAVFGATQIFGGEDSPPPPNTSVEPTGTAGTDAGTTGNERVADARPETVVGILNGTPTEGLAKQLRDKLIAEGYSDQQGMIRTGNNTDQQRQDSVVLYAEGKRRQARDVATILGISDIEAMDPDTQALADSTDDTGSGTKSAVVVVAGADQSP